MKRGKGEADPRVPAGVTASGAAGPRVSPALARPPLPDPALDEPVWLRWLLIGLVVLAMGALVALPLAVVIVEAFAQGFGAYLSAVQDPETLSAIKLTLLVAAITVPLNALFGIAAAWALTRHEFRGKRVLLALIDLPFAISPVVAGLVFVLLFGAQGWWGPWLGERDIQVIFALPGIVLATVFITFPFVARELIPLMQTQGRDEEEAAASLGAGGWTLFWRVTVPNIKWALMYGVLLCNARAMGEFGAVSVVSGHIRGLTNTLPLQVEILHNEFNTAAAFAVASLLTVLALLTLLLKLWLEARHGDALAARGARH